MIVFVVDYMIIMNLKTCFIPEYVVKYITSVQHGKKCNDNHSI